MVKFIYKKSPVSGYGLFATEDIKKDETICRYFGKKVKVNGIKPNFFRYGLVIDNNTILCGETDIKKLPVDGYGQFLNDGAFIEKDPDVYINGLNDFTTYYDMQSPLNDWINDNTIKLLAEYVYYQFNSVRNNSVKFNIDNKADKVTIISTRDIKKGEELFIQYGFQYWISTYTQQYSEKMFNVCSSRKVLKHIPTILEIKIKLIADYVKKNTQMDEKKLKAFNEYIQDRIDKKPEIKYMIKF